MKTRGQSFKVRGRRFKDGARQAFFIQRVVGAWNELPEMMVEADTIVEFR